MSQQPNSGSVGPLSYETPGDPAALTAQQLRGMFFSSLKAATPVAYVTWILVAINVAVYIAMGIAGVGWFEVDTQKLLHWGADYWPYAAAGQWWRLLTGAFVHIGLLHIAFNMWALISVGRLTERMFGNLTFAFIYLVTAVLSSLTAIWWDKTSVEAGASGAIFALFGATLAYLLLQKRALPKLVSQPLISSTAAVIGYNIYIGVTTTGVSNAAHIGGLVTGFILGAVMCRPLDQAEREQQATPRFVTGAIVSAALLAGMFYFIPKSSSDIKGEEAYKSFQIIADDREKNAINKYNSMLDQAKVGKLSDDDFAKTLDADLVPEYGRMAAEMLAIQIMDGSPSKLSRDQMAHYYQLRHDALSAFSKYIHTSDEAAKKKYQELWSQAQSFAQSLHASSGGK